MDEKKVEKLKKSKKTKKPEKNFKKFFPNYPKSEVSSALKRVLSTTNNVRKFIFTKLKKFDLIIGQSNRPDKSHLLLVEGGILPVMDYFFTGSKAGAEHLSKNWFEREVIETDGIQTPFIWDSSVMWESFFSLLKHNRDKKILVVSSASRVEHESLKEYKNIIFASPSPRLADKLECDKRNMSSLYQSFNIPYPVYNYDSSDEVEGDYYFYVQKLNSTELVIQATQSSGGVTLKNNRSLYFIKNEKDFSEAIANLKNEGPLRIMKNYKGDPSNISALTLPFGVFISGIPNTKMCGIKELGVRPGTNGGNQWDLHLPELAIEAGLVRTKEVGKGIGILGYYGIYGLDFIVSDTDNNEKVFNTEINARTQGSDLPRASATYGLGIPMLEELQLAFYLGCKKEIFPNPDDYNLITRWLMIPPCLKLFSKEDKIVKSNLNGYWDFKDGLIRTEQEKAMFRITGAPEVGQKILKNAADNFLYIRFIDPELVVYKGGKLTPFALSIVNIIYEII